MNIFEVMIKSITNVLIIFFIFQQLKSQIDQNGYNAFCDETLQMMMLWLNLPQHINGSTYPGVIHNKNKLSHIAIWGLLYTNVMLNESLVILYFRTPQYFPLYTTIRRVRWRNKRALHRPAVYFVNAHASGVCETYSITESLYIMCWAVTTASI